MPLKPLVARSWQEQEQLVKVMDLLRQLPLQLLPLVILI